MLTYNFTYRAKKKKALPIVALLIYWSVVSLLISCVPYNANKQHNGVTFAASLGSPPVDSIVWSPTDEDKILITAGDIGRGSAEVYILNLDTGRKQILASTKYGDFIAATWAPDGKHVLLQVRKDTQGYDPGGLWILNIDNPSSEYFTDSGPSAWAPDGKTIATFSTYMISDNVMKINLQLINAKTKEKEIIYKNTEAKYSFGLSWSPDGRYLTFSIGQVELSDLYTLDIETQKTARLTENQRNYNPVWSPRGNVITYESWPSTGTRSTLHLIRSDGKCDTEIPDLEYVWSPTWSPDGKKLGYIGTDGIYFLEIDKVLGRDIYQSLCG